MVLDLKMRDLRTYMLGRRRSIDHDIREVFIRFGYPEFVEIMPGHDAKLTPIVFEGQRIARQFLCDFFLRRFISLFAPNRYVGPFHFVYEFLPVWKEWGPAGISV